MIDKYYARTLVESNELCNWCVFVGPFLSIGCLCLQFLTIIHFYFLFSVFFSCGEILKKAPIHLLWARCFMFPQETKIIIIVISVLINYAILRHNSANRPSKWKPFAERTIFGSECVDHFKWIFGFIERAS